MSPPARTSRQALSTAQLDRAVGVVLGGACGDALGAGYEFTFPAPDLVPEMVGGGLGGFAPGEWTDDTAQAVAILRVAADGRDLRSGEALDRVAQGFADWYAGGPADVGVQTSAVLSRAGRRPTGAAMAAAAEAVHRETGRSAGNGSLMRTGPVVLAHLHDPEALVQAASAVGALTHHEDVAREACAVWCLLVRHAVLTGELPRFDDVAAWAPDPDAWRERLAEAERRPPSSFTQNGWAVGALQAAWSAVVRTPVPLEGPACGHLVDALGTAVRIGHDTDTVAAIAGSLLGARWGASAVPARWRRVLHGWPGLDARDLERLAHLAAMRGHAGAHGWARADRVDFAALQGGHPPLVRHPHDDGVWLAAAPALDDLAVRLPEVDAVVSLCLTGSRQVPDGVEQVKFRLVDRAEAGQNPHLDFVLDDVAATIAALRAEGRRVLVHCVAAHSRTPAAAIAYALHRGVPLAEAERDVGSALPGSSPNPAFREALARLAGRGPVT